MASSESPFARMNWDKFVQRVLKGGDGVLYQTAVISIEEEAVLGASKNLELWQDEVETLQEMVRKKTLHQRLFSVGFKQYVATSVQGRSFYGRGIDLLDPCGICILETPKVIFLATFKLSHNNGVPSRAIPYVISYADKLNEL
eukprot:TRINITY_DN941_c0_g2_i1.p2 TRINITY_DN941_c0_g2~~TRINITY_DN941_c0_g2_i1.p2  ORF type:complete len:152 (+),score=36.70 TRINITY_DN941_c0_g2_i1:28-456(+)